MSIMYIVIFNIYAIKKINFFSSINRTIIWTHFTLISTFISGAVTKFSHMLYQYKPLLYLY